MPPCRAQVAQCRSVSLSVAQWISGWILEGWWCAINLLAFVLPSVEFFCFPPYTK